jgi:hypothetical protein
VGDSARDDCFELCKGARAVIGGPVDGLEAKLQGGL